MRALDVLFFALNALLQHRRRTLLSLLGVMIGIMAVVFLTGLGEGARRYVINEFAAIGSNIIVVIPGKTETAGALPGMGGAPNDLTLSDARSLKHQLRGIREVIPVAIGNDTVSFQERRRQLIVLGTTKQFFEARSLHPSRGKLLPEAAMDRGAAVVVIGDTVAKELYPGSEPVGQVLRVGGARMRVIGVLAHRGTQMGQNVDEMVFAPVATVMRIFNRSSLFRILIQLHSHSDADAIKEQVISIISERHDEEDITCITQDAILESLGGILRALTMALTGIGGISLAVAGIGIMNVMLVSVSERTSEVGLLKALGAKRTHVLAVFLTEAALLSSAGGAIGLGLGWAALQLLIWFYPAVPAATPAWAAIGALGIAAITGPVFGVLPAWRATQLDPVQALARK